MSSSRARLGGGRRRMPRTSRLAAVFAALWLVLVSTGDAQSARIPASKQAAFLTKVASFDRNFAARAGGRAVVLLVQAANDAESARDAAGMKAALREIPSIGNVPHDELLVTYKSASALADLVRSRRVSIVYFSSGFSGQISAVRDAFSSLDVLTFGAVPEYVPPGVVLAVDLVSGRPKLVINITQANRQHVSFPASVLNLMKVYR